MSFVYIHEILVPESPRTRQIRGMFDLGDAKSSRTEIQCAFPKDELANRPWSIGLILGPSGSGKSTMLRSLFGEPWQSPPRTDRAVVDEFPQELSIQNITALLSAVGFSSPRRGSDRAKPFPMDSAFAPRWPWLWRLPPGTVPHFCWMNSPRWSIATPPKSAVWPLPKRSIRPTSALWPPVAMMTSLNGCNPIGLPGPTLAPSSGGRFGPVPPFVLNFNGSKRANGGASKRITI